MKETKRRMEFSRFTTEQESQSTLKQWLRKAGFSKKSPPLRGRIVKSSRRKCISPFPTMLRLRILSRSPPRNSRHSTNSASIRDGNLRLQAYICRSFTMKTTTQPPSKPTRCWRSRISTERSKRRLSSLIFCCSSTLV